jgi:hypothetical protein
VDRLWIDPSEPQQCAAFPQVARVDEGSASSVRTTLEGIYIGTDDLEGGWEVVLFGVFQNILIPGGTGIPASFEAVIDEPDQIAFWISMTSEAARRPHHQ